MLSGVTVIDTSVLYDRHVGAVKDTNLKHDKSLCV